MKIQFALVFLLVIVGQALESDHQTPDQQILLQDNDVVNQMLGDLISDATNQLIQLDKDWKTAEKVKKSSVDEFAQIKTEQSNECLRRQSQVEAKAQQLQQSQQYNAFLESRSAANKQRLETIEKTLYDFLKNLRCDSQEVYLKGLRESKISIRLAQYIHDVIEKIDKVDTSFVEIGREITEEEPKQQEEDQTALAQTKVEMPDEWSYSKRQKFQEDKPKIFSLLDGLNTQYSASVESNQQNTIRSITTELQFSIAVNQEISMLQALSTNEKNTIISFTDQLQTLTFKYKACQNRLQEVNVAYQLALTDLSTSEANVKDLRAKLTYEKELFEDLQHYYASQVYIQMKDS